MCSALPFGWLALPVLSLAGSIECPIGLSVERKRDRVHGARGKNEQYVRFNLVRARIVPSIRRAAEPEFKIILIE